MSSVSVPAHRPSLVFEGYRPVRRSDAIVCRLRAGQSTGEDGESAPAIGCFLDAARLPSGKLVTQLLKKINTGFETSETQEIIR